ncbi:hypothetical protein I316_07622 [Kwoniella heveanensis BCC8398]|uniref:BZIP domain-containing protein n=1 Tax=Kwoniella heveanensis BCC8398 TaxID=1296120 RepID=A0A1B9GI96_9TREE|nr:hypothetical protein I316_07622 [Kwoniella heveanensis BCC8398]
MEQSASENSRTGRGGAGTSFDHDTTLNESPTFDHEVKAGWSPRFYLNSDTFSQDQEHVASSVYEVGAPSSQSALPGSASLHGTDGATGSMTGFNHMAWSPREAMNEPFFQADPGDYDAALGTSSSPPYELSASSQVDDISLHSASQASTAVERRRARSTTTASGRSNSSSVLSARNSNTKIPGSVGLRERNRISARKTRERKKLEQARKDEQLASLSRQIAQMSGTIETLDAMTAQLWDWNRAVQAENAHLRSTLSQIPAECVSGHAYGSASAMAPTQPSVVDMRTTTGFPTDASTYGVAPASGWPNTQALDAGPAHSTTGFSHDDASYHRNLAKIYRDEIHKTEKSLLEVEALRKRIKELETQNAQLTDTSWIDHTHTQTYTDIHGDGPDWLVQSVKEEGGREQGDGGTNLPMDGTRTDACDFDFEISVSLENQQLAAKGKERAQHE